MADENDFLINNLLVSRLKGREYPDSYYDKSTLSGNPGSHDQAFFNSQSMYDMQLFPYKYRGGLFNSLDPNEVADVEDKRGESPLSHEDIERAKSNANLINYLKYNILKMFPTPVDEGGKLSADAGFYDIGK